MKLQKASKDNDDDDNRATSSQTGRLRTLVGGVAGREGGS